MTASADWYHYILRPEILWAVIAIVGILAWAVVSVVRLQHRHRERLAMIERGMHPDPDERPRS